MGVIMAKWDQQCLFIYSHSPLVNANAETLHCNLTNQNKFTKQSICGKLLLNNRKCNVYINQSGTWRWRPEAIHTSTAPQKNTNDSPAHSAMWSFHSKTQRDKADQTVLPLRLLTARLWTKSKQLPSGWTQDLTGVSGKYNKQQITN